MSHEKRSAALDAVPRKSLKARLPEDGPDLKRIKDAGKLISTALERAGISQKEAAIDMGLSEAQLSMQLDGVPGNHLSWQRLNRLSDVFFLELLIVLAEHRGIARVRTQIEWERTKVSA